MPVILVAQHHFLMKDLTWNVHGPGNAKRYRTQGRYLWAWDVEVLLLQEMKPTNADPKYGDKLESLTYLGT